MGFGSFTNYIYLCRENFQSQKGRLPRRDSFFFLVLFFNLKLHCPRNFAPHLPLKPTLTPFLQRATKIVSRSDHRKLSCCAIRGFPALGASCVCHHQSLQASTILNSSQSKMAPTSSAVKITGTKILRSSRSSSPDPVVKRIKREPSLGASEQVEHALDGPDLGGWGYSTRQFTEECSGLRILQAVHDRAKIKADRAEQHAQDENRFIAESITATMEEHERQKRDGPEREQTDYLLSPPWVPTTPTRSKSPPSPLSSPPWVPTSPYMGAWPPQTNSSPPWFPTSPYWSPQAKSSPVWLPESPTQYGLSPPPSPSKASSHSTRIITSPSGLYSRGNRSRPPPSPPRLQLLSSPSGRTLSPLFSPKPSPRVNSSRAVHPEDLEDILGGTEFGDLKHIMPSPADDVFDTARLQQNQHSRLVKKKHNTYLRFHVSNPAKGVMSEWAVVAWDGHKEMTGYPCEDFKFRTDERQILGSWDEMGNIRDLEGNFVH
jgi:hypothetical protein